MTACSHALGKGGPAMHPTTSRSLRAHWPAALGTIALLTAFLGAVDLSTHSRGVPAAPGQVGNGTSTVLDR